MELPRFLRELISRPEYRNPNSDEYITAQKYFNLLYPGTVQFDATGRMIQPEYDMTIAEFENAQAQIDAEIEKAKRELERSLQDPDEEPEEENDDENSAPTVQIVLKGLVAIRVLIIDDLIVTKNLKIYDLKVIENSDEDDGAPEPDPDICVYVWCEDGECDDCAAMAGTILDGPNIPDSHPNCRCYAVLMPWSEYTEKFGAPDPKKQEKYRMLQKKEQEYKNKEKQKHDVKDMKISDKGINWLKSKENKVLNEKGIHIIYDDKTGKPVPVGEPLPDGATIGYGHLIKPGEDFSKGLTEQQALELYRQDLQDAQNIVRNNIQVPLTQNQFDALTSLAYNIGSGNFSPSTIVKYVNGANEEKLEYPTPEAAWKAWNKSRGKVMRGLINRRNDEWEMFSKGIYKI